MGQSMSSPDHTFVNASRQSGNTVMRGLESLLKECRFAAPVDKEWNSDAGSRGWREVFNYFSNSNDERAR